MKGEMKGEMKGRQEGERNAKLEFARKLLLCGNSIADIMELTDLPVDELEQLAKTLQ